VRDDPTGWFELGRRRWRPWRRCDVVLMRKDPPVDAQYLHDTQILGWRPPGRWVVNDPQGLRDMNEKLAALPSRSCFRRPWSRATPAALKAFVAPRRVRAQAAGRHGRALDLPRRGDDPNLNVILETLTGGGRQLALAQRYLPEIAEGDKRILLVDGEPVPYVPGAHPPGHDFRGNLAAGGAARAAR
jgi:glutathione synthase